MVVHSSGGPWIVMAVFCEQVIEDKQGVLTIVRVIDQVNVEVSGTEAPERMPPGAIRLTFVITVKAGDSHGRFEIETEVEEPSGITKPISSHSVTIPAAHYGANLINRITLGVQHEGVYWFNVKTDGRVLTRAPLEIRYIRSSSPSLAGQ